VLKKNIVVETSDPARPRIRLTIAGKVDRFIRIAPRRLRLEGTVGMPVKRTARIILTKKYPVKLLTARAKNDRNLHVELEKVPGDDPEEYRLTVQSAYTKAGRYYDTVVITTDSQLRPSISIGVFANITPVVAPPKS
jgi:hypothetical protein